MSMCRKCRLILGYSRKDEGSHVAYYKRCAHCGEMEQILPDHLWYKRPFSEVWGNGDV